MNTEKNLAALTDEELLDAAKGMKSSAITHAALIGFMIGIVVYSVARNGFGFFALIPLFLAYKFSNQPENKKKNEELKRLLKKRNLK